MIRVLVLVSALSIVGAARVHANCQLTTDNAVDLAAAQKAVDDARGAKDQADAALAKARGIKNSKALPAAQQAVDDANAKLTEAIDTLKTKLAVAATNQVDLTGQPARVGITLSNPPGERLRVSFDLSTGAHREVEWDPAVDTSLTRTVTLEKGLWSISASAEAQTFNQQAGTVVINLRFGNLESMNGDTTRGRIDGQYVALGIAAGGGVMAPTVVTAWPRPRLAFACDPTATGTMADQQFAVAVTSSGVDGGVRGFGVAPAIVTDTLALLAEIAVDRARAGALDVLKRRLVDPFCKDDSKISLAKLGIGGHGDLALPRTCELLRSLRLDDVLSSGRPVLIALRDDLRLTIAPAVAETLADTDQDPRTPDIDSHTLAVLRVVVSTVDAMIERGGFDALQGQLALELLAQVEHVGLAQVTSVRAALESRLATALSVTGHVAAIATAIGYTCPPAGCGSIDETAIAGKLIDRVLTGHGWVWNDAGTKQDVATAVVGAIRAQNDAPLNEALQYGCQARLVVAVVKRCSGGGCTAADITTMVTSPEKYFAAEDTLPGALCWEGKEYVKVPGNKDLVAAQRLVINGLALVSPAADGQGRDRARAVVRFITQVGQRVGTDDQFRKLQAFGDLAVAIIDEDYGSAFARFLSLVDRLLPESEQDPKKKESHAVVRKFAQLIGAVASYAVVYRETKDSDPAAAREARKRALSTIIDSMTDRAERGDELVVSLGSNVGLSYSWRDVDRRADSDAMDDQWQPRVRVPLGVRLECLRKRDAKGLSGLGVFGSVNVIDLGQFVRGDEDDDFAEVEWADFVGIGGELGVSHTRFARELNLSIHASYAPSIRYTTNDGADQDADDDHRAGVWTVGVALGYYVPFIDLN